MENFIERMIKSDPDWSPGSPYCDRVAEIGADGLADIMANSIASIAADIARAGAMSAAEYGRLVAETQANSPAMVKAIFEACGLASL